MIGIGAINLSKFKDSKKVTNDRPDSKAMRKISSEDQIETTEENHFNVVN